MIGKFKRVGKTLEIVNPLVGCEDALKSEIIPKYPLKGDLTDKLITKLISLVLDSIKITENLPIEMCERYGMISLDKAIREIHFPKGKEMLDKAIKRLKFQELFTYSMKLLLLKEKSSKIIKVLVFLGTMKEWESLEKHFRTNWLEHKQGL